MKTAKKVTIITAIALLAIGLIISLCALIPLNFNFASLNTFNSAVNEYTVNESFRNISIEGVECDIRLMVSDDDKCRVNCVEEEKISHTVKVADDTLKIERKDNRKWYERIQFFYWENMRIDIYLPKTEFADLYIESTSGDINISEKISFEKAELENTSGDINISKISADYIDIQTTSGDITINSVKADSELKLSSVSGDFDISDVDCRNISAETTSGNQKLSGVIAEKNMKINSVSGDIYFKQSDSDDIFVNTISGNVKGTILSDKIFNVDTTSGDINVPKSAVGGRCEITTTSGDINIALKE